MYTVLVKVCSYQRNVLNHAGESGRTLTWGERVKVAIGVARGLNYLHENNIAHGGIKPSNILLNHELKPLVLTFNLIAVEQHVFFFL